LDFDGHTLEWGERSVSAASVEGFREHFSTWTGRAWMSVEGPGWRVPIAEDYGAVRADLRTWFPDRPFTADWADGRFPPAPLGMPSDLLLLAVGGGVLMMSMVLSAGLGPGAGGVGLVAGLWPVARLRDGVVVREEGIRVGPGWAPTIPWHAISGVSFERRSGTCRLWLRTPRGSGVGTVPSVLLPALRARIWRLGGLKLAPIEDEVDARYARWQVPAIAAPWGVLLGTVVSAFLVEQPWPILCAGLLTMAALAMLSAAIEARATGWGAGGVFWFTGVYATVLVALAVGGLL